MRYLIDTSSLSRAIWDDSFELRRVVWDLGIDQIVVSVITIFEIEYGLTRRNVRNARAVTEFLGYFGTIDFGPRDAVAAGKLRSRMEARGRQIGVMDTLIAAQALVRDLTVITHNMREFARIDDLRLLEL
jgi:tRNA(fMet)-specific endonuclease VapC